MPSIRLTHVGEGRYFVDFRHRFSETKNSETVNFKEVSQLCQFSFNIRRVTPSQIEYQFSFSHEMEKDLSIADICEPIWEPIVVMKLNTDFYSRKQNPIINSVCSITGDLQNIKETQTEVFFIQFDLKKESFDPETESVSQHFENIWTNKICSDVSFKINGNEIQAHTQILASGSPVLAAMFQNDFTENRERVVKIEDVEADVMEQLLRYLYTGKIDQEINAFKLLVAADKYGIDSLKLKSAHLIKKQLTVANSIESLVVSQLFNISSLEEFVLKFMQKNSMSVLSLDEWPEFMKEQTELCLKAIRAMIK